MANDPTLVGLIEQANISNNLYNIASTAYAECSTGASTPIKDIAIPGFAYKTGVTIHVKFANKHSADTAPSLRINSAGDAIPIMQYGTTNAGKAEETSGWHAGAVVSLTYDGTNWIRDLGYNTNTTYTIKDTYSGTDGNPISGKGVKAAIDELDVSNITANLATNKTITALSETDGKIAATASNIQITEDQVTNLTTDLSNKAPKASPTFTGTVTLPAITSSSADTAAATKKYVDDKTAALSGAMHFKGAVLTLPEATDSTTFSTYESGDVILGPNNKEYVYNKGNNAASSEWVELGDESSFALSTQVINKSIITAKGDIIYGNALNDPTILSPNTSTTKLVLVMASSTPDWMTLTINKGTGSFPTLSTTNTTEFLLASTAALTTGTAFSVPNVTSMTTASVNSDAVLVITNGTIANDNFSIPNVTGIDTGSSRKATALTAASLSGGSFPTPSFTYTT